MTVGPFDLVTFAIAFVGFGVNFFLMGFALGYDRGGARYAYLPQRIGGLTLVELARRVEKGEILIFAPAGYKHAVVQSGIDQILRDAERVLH